VKGTGARSVSWFILHPVFKGKGASTVPRQWVFEGCGRNGALMSHADADNRMKTGTPVPDGMQDRSLQGKKLPWLRPGCRPEFF